MARDIQDYVAGCQLCTRNKAKTHKKHGKLNPLPVPEGKWTGVAMDFITDLPKTKNGNTAILTYIDAATRRGRFIACKLAGLTAEKTANITIYQQIWKQLGEVMGFEQTPTTTANQQGNGLAERINQSIESYLRSYVNFEQNNWDEYLDLFEFCWNNSKHAATGMAPFYADQGYLPNFQIKSEEPADPMTSESAANHAKKKMKHQDIEFSVGDLVMLKTGHIRTSRVCKKLAEKQIGPFKIIKKVTDQTYQLELKNLVGRIYDVFYVNKLEKYKDIQTGQQQYGAKWFVDEEETYRTLKDITNSRIKNDIYEYEVCWSDGSKNWIAKDDFDHDEIEIQVFHNRHPENPFPNDRLLEKNARSRNPPTRYSD
ncbi:hypothetical protein K3495_g9577 [Podosphaera aphanis]|nr:hypothetical protein K3495_g9577 [Podosphaera aphanis]